MQPFFFCPTLPVFSFLSGFCIFKMPSRACLHLKDDKLLLLCVFSVEGQNGSRNEGSNYFFSTFYYLVKSKYPGLPFSTDHANGLNVDDGMLEHPGTAPICS